MSATAVRALLLSLLFSALGIGGVLLFGPDFDLQVIARASPGYLLLSLGMMLGSFVFASLRLQALCRDLGHPLAFLQGVRIHILGVLGALLTPGGSGGAPLITLALSHHGLRAEAGLAVAVGIFAADMLFYMWTTPVALITLFSLGEVPVNAVWVLGGVVAVAISGFLAFLALFRVGWLGRLADVLSRGPLLRFRKRILRFIRGFVEVSELFPYRSLSWHLRVQSLTFLSWLSFFLVLPLVALAYGVQPDVLVLFAYQLVVTALSTVVPTPGGSGLFEFGIGTVLVRRGHDAASLSVTLVWRLITYYLIFLIGPFLGGFLLTGQKGGAGKRE